jgi:hypothetical protein
LFGQQAGEAAVFVAVGLGDVGALVLRVTGQSKDRHGLVAVVVHNPRAALLAAPFMSSKYPLKRCLPA